ncbi:hypothetical protein L7F22_067865 [Adiantum nelumboides]|nr:hypothetical protein [Adiantum nelumboides]
MSSDSLLFLITGASRGIGFALVETLLARPNTTVIATVRDLNSPNVVKLYELLKAKASGLNVIKLDSAVPEDTVKSIEIISNQFQLDHIDVVIANAGNHNSQESAFMTDMTDNHNIRQAIEINTIAPLQLFQATRHLLLASKLPEFIIISSVAGSLQYAVNSIMSNLSYSLSKAAVNVVGIRIAQENNEIITLILSPGLVGTDMVLGLAKELPAFGEWLNSNPPITSKESAEKLLNLIDNAQKADSGRIIDATDGKTLPW